MTRNARSWLGPVAVRASVVGVLAGLLLTGCGSEADPGTGGTTVDHGSSAQTTDPTTSSDGTGSDESTGAPTMVDTTKAAIAQLAGKLGVDATSVTVVSSEPVTWRDGSIGCPKKGMGYTQMLVSGYLVILAVDGTTYRYHAGSSGAPFLCEGEAQDPLPPGDGPA